MTPFSTLVNSDKFEKPGYHLCSSCMFLDIFPGHVITNIKLNIIIPYSMIVIGLIFLCFIKYAKTQVYTINSKLIETEEKFDGFYGVCTNLEDGAEEIIKINRSCFNSK